MVLLSTEKQMLTSNFDNELISSAEIMWDFFLLNLRIYSYLSKDILVNIFVHWNKCSCVSPLIHCYLVKSKGNNVSTPDGILMKQGYWYHKLLKTFS